MNYQSFIHLQLKTLLKNVFHSIKIELRDVKGEKNSFCFRWNYTSCSLFSQDFGQSFLIYTSHEMVAQSSANFPIYRGHARQCGKGFGALAQTLGRTAIPFFKKYVVPAAKRIGADLFEMAAPEIREVTSGQKQNISKHLQKTLEQKQFENSWDVEK